MKSSIKKKEAIIDFKSKKPSSISGTFSVSLIIVEDNGKYALFDIQGNQIFPTQTGQLLMLSPSTASKLY